MLHFVLHFFLYILILFKTPAWKQRKIAWGKACKSKIDKDSQAFLCWIRLSVFFKMAERVGFEPTAPCGVTGFQDRLLKPLGHLSNQEYPRHRFRLPERRAEKRIRRPRQKAIAERAELDYTIHQLRRQHPLRRQSITFCRSLYIPVIYYYLMHSSWITCG